MIHCIIWRSTRSPSRLLFIANKLQQTIIMLCGFHSKAWRSIAWRRASSDIDTSLSHYQLTLSTYDKLWKGIVLILGVISSIPPTFSRTSSFSSIVKLIITLVHNNTLPPRLAHFWTPNLKTHKQNTPLPTSCTHLNTKT